MHRFIRTLLVWAGTIVLGSCAQDAAPHGANFFAVEGLEDGVCGNTESQFRCWGSLWGLNLYSATPVVPQTPFNDWRHISMNSYADEACGLDGMGRLYCGASGEVLAPGVQFSQVSVGGTSRCALATTGVVYCWGDQSTSGVALSDPGVSTCGSSQYAYPCVLQPTPIASTDRFSAIASGDFHHCALATSGQVLCWGGDPSSLGRGPDVADPQAPGPITGSEQYRALAAAGYRSCGVTVGGDLACWGSVPEIVAFPEPTSLKTVSLSSSSACVLDSTNAAWCWGGGGLGTGVDNDTPLPVLGNLTFTSITVGGRAACGIAGNGAWCWGAPTGDGSFSWSVIPVRVANQDQFDDD